jgi:type IV secretion system protein VirB6/type IV secretion system protein TrbL
MKVPAIVKSLAITALWGLALFSLDAHAQLSSAGVLDSVVQKYQSIASGWSGAITTAANFVFWSLVAISMVWTFGFMALRKADIGEFFAEFLRFTIFNGFFFWLLTNGPTMATAIINGLKQLGANAGGSALSPSSIVDLGFQVFFNVVNQSSVWSPVDSGVGLLIGAVVLVVFALIGVNMVVVLVTSWFLAYAGIFYLGFGGSRWTSEMAISYYKSTLGLGMELLSMELLISAGLTIVNQYVSGMAASYTMQDLGVVLVAAIVLLVLADKIPARLAAIAGGGSGVGHFGAGSALGAAAVAAAAAATGGAVMAAAGKNLAGGAQALMSAVSKASENMATGGGMFKGSGMGADGKGGASVASAMGGNGSDAAPVSGSSGGSSAGSGGAGSTAPGTGAGESGASSEGPTSGASGNASQDAAGSTSAGTGDSGASEKGADSENPKNPSAARQMASVAGRFSADVAANLAKGAIAVGKDKMQATATSLRNDISKTVGGQIAAKISGSSASATQTQQSASTTPSFGGNGLSGSNEANVDRDAEKAAFVNRKAS